MVDVEHLFLKTNDIWLHTAAAGPLDGPLIVFLHGFPEFWYAWAAQIDYLARQGFRVLAPDQRGYNLSDHPRGVSAYSLDMLAGDIAGLIEAAGREKAIIVGHDWGGAVAWWLAKKCPARVEKLVILNAPHWLAMQDDLQTNPNQWLHSSYIGYFQIPWLPERLFSLGNWAPVAGSLKKTSRPGTFTPSDLRLYRQAWAQPGAFTAMLNWYRAILRFRPRFPENPYINAPTLIIWGEQDPFLGKELARMSLEMCQQGRLVMFRAATHWIQHEEPNQVNEFIRAFVEG
jgi:epoxide hydrolase 4